MSFFTSDRERRLWIWTALAVIAIYSTLGAARVIAGALRERNLLAVSIMAAVILIVMTLMIQWVKKRPDWREIGVAIAVVFAYLMVGFRMGSWEERTHLIEYGVVAALIHMALIERSANGKKFSKPAVMAVLATAILGLLDECIQAFLPSRVFDFRDVFFNAFAGFLVVAARLAIAPQKGPGWRIWFLWLIAAAYGWGTTVEITGLGELSLTTNPERLMDAYLGAAIAGILVGGLQWLIIRGKIAQSWLWIVASVGSSILFGVVIYTVNIADTEMGWIVGIGMYGLITGVFQWLILRKQMTRTSWWILASIAGWVGGIPAAESVGWNGLGAVYGAVTGIALVLLLKQPTQNSQIPARNSMT